MPNWKKLVTSGSDASLNSINVETFVSASSFVGDGSGLTGLPTQTLDLSEIDQHIIPQVDNVYDLGSPTKQWRDLYLSSASLYIDGTKVISSDSNTLTFTTDAGQSIKLLETGGDDITLQTDTGNIELKGTVEIQSGKKITDSAGTKVLFGDSLGITGSIDLTGTVDGIDLQAFSSSVALGLSNTTADYTELTNIPAGIVSSSSQITITESQISDLVHYTDSDVKTKLNSEGVVSGSSQVDYNSIQNTPTTISTQQASEITANTAKTGITAQQASDITANNAKVGYTDTLVKTKLNTEGVISGSSQLTITQSQISDVNATATELNYVEGVTSNIQTQLDTKQAVGSYVTTTSIQALSSATNALTFAANTLTLTRGDGSTDTVNLSAYLDDTNLARVISGTYNSSNQELVFTRDDATTFTIDASMFFDDTNLVTSVNAGSGISVNQATGGVTVTNTAQNVTTNLSTTANSTSLTINSSDGTNASIPAATTSAWGAMTDEDKNKLDGIAAGANLITDNNQLTNGAGYIDSFDITTQTDSKYLRSDTSDTMNGSLNVTGNLGIDTSSPLLKLHIKGTNSLPATSGTAQNGGIRIENGVNNGVLDIGASNATGAPGWIQATDKTDLSQTYNLLLNPNGGNVGIGTTTPNSGYKLDISGNLKASGNIVGGSFYNAGANYVFGLSTTEGEYINRTGNDIIVYAGGSARLTIDGDEGNVGIGTTTFPTTTIGERELLVQGAIVSKPPGIDDYYSYLKSNWAAESAFELGIQGADVNHKLITTSNYYNGTQLNFHTSDQKRMVIDAGGNVGIGTTSPSANLEIEAASNPEISIASTGGATSNYLNFKATSHTQPIQNQIKTVDNNDFTADLVFSFKGTGTSGALTERIRIKPDGNVGIGTSSPDKPLTIQTSDSSYGSMRIYRDSATLGETAIGFFGTATQAANQAWVIGEGGWGNNGDFVIGNENGGAGGNVRLLVERGGNVGIGTTSPAAALHVNGSTRVEGILTPTTVRTLPGNTEYNLLTRNSTGNALFVQNAASNTNQPIASFQYGGEAVNTGGVALQVSKDSSYFLSNVGIGTTSPSEKLDVAGIIRASSLTIDGASNRYIYINSSDGLGECELRLGDAADSDAGSIAYNNADDSMQFRAGASERMRIDSSGKVLIGYTTAANSVGSLQVDGYIDIDHDKAFRLYDSTFIGGFGNGIWATGLEAYRDDAAVYAVNDLLLMAGGDNTPDAIILANGNVGIGTTSPTAKLEIYGSGSTVLDIQGSQGQLFSVTDDLTGDLFSVSDISGVPILNVNASGDSYFDGNLETTGNQTIGGILTVQGEIQGKADIIAYHSSDERLKENIKPIDNATDKVKQIGGYTFDWKSDIENITSRSGNDIGLIAQEVEKVIPQVVTTRSNGYKGVDYQKLVALLIESNKELASRIEELEKKIQ